MPNRFYDSNPRTQKTKVAGLREQARPPGFTSTYATVYRL